MSRRKPHGDNFHLTTVNMAESTDHPDIAFDNPLQLIAHVNATYPEHTSYLITVVRRNNTIS